MTDATATARKITGSGEALSATNAEIRELAEAYLAAHVGPKLAADRRVDLSLLKIDGPSEGPLYFIVQSDYPQDVEDDAELQSGRRYFYEEHSCPTNWLRNAVELIHVGQVDPHGAFKHVRTVRVSADFDDELDGDTKYLEHGWQALFPEAFPVGEPVDEMFSDEPLPPAEAEEVARLRDKIAAVRPPPAPGLSAVTVARAFEVMLPKHDDCLTIVHNPQLAIVHPEDDAASRGDLCTVAAWLREWNRDLSFTGPVEQQKCETLNDIWVLYWTPPGETKESSIAAASLPALAAWLEDNGLAFGS